MSGLRKHERCPLHHRTDCCGRQAKVKRTRGIVIKGPVTRIPDDAGGFRELCSPAEMRRRKTIKVRQQNEACAYCHERFTDYREVDLHHLRAKGMGSASRDDSLPNLAAVHRECHQEIHQHGSMERFLKEREANG